MNKWATVRWQDGEVIKETGNSGTARHLYFNNIWYGLLSGMTDDTEELILKSLNNCKNYEK